MSGALLTRTHSKSGLTATAEARVLVTNVSLVPEEPDILFVGNTIATSNPINQGSAAPNLDVVAFTGPIGSMLRVTLKWLQGATETSSDQIIYISVDLVLRPA